MTKLSTCWILAFWLGSSLSSALDSFAPSRNPPFNMNVSDIPQFVLLTFEDKVSTYAMTLMQPITTVRDRYGCGVRGTFFVTVEDDDELGTECSMIDALRQGQHEIATNTFGNVLNPSKEEIEQARTWLNSKCNVPLEEMKGFRAPGLQYSQDTWDWLAELGFLYDSSLVTDDHRASNFGRQHMWPWTFDSDLHPDLECTCTRNKTNPGLWEVPLWRNYDSLDEPMLPSDYSGDPFDDLTANLDRRMNGNRAPLGVYFHAGWLLENNYRLKRWVEAVMDKHNDVHFITTTELIEWMRNPIRKRRYRQRCTDQESECYTPLPIDCAFGSFNPDSCGCDCMAGYCTDSAGQCKQTTGCGDVDGGWSDWKPSDICCDEQHMLTRTCTNPSPRGAGKDCNDTSLKVDYCFPDQCPNGGWSDWGDYSRCCEGEKTRTRECLAAPTINAGRGCIGADTDTVACGPDECKRRYYPSYDRGACDYLPFPPDGSTFSDGSNNYQDCCAEHFSWDESKCIDGSANPPVHGGWSSWSDAGPCCGGKRVLTRTCTDPAPAFKGDDCVGSDVIEEACDGNECPNGGWSEWSQYGPCCDRQSTRTRICLAPPETGCEGEAEESIFCPEDECVKTFSPNFNRQICVRIYDGESVTGASDLTYNDAGTCCTTHFNENYDQCMNNAQIPIDGGWGPWSGFGPCCEGSRVRYRACNNPKPVNGGLDCEGPTSETESCFPNTCSVGDYNGGSSGIRSTPFQFTLALVFTTMVFLLLS